MSEVAVWSNVMVSPFGDDADSLVGMVLTGPVERNGRLVHLIHFGQFMNWHPAAHLKPLLQTGEQRLPAPARRAPGKRHLNIPAVGTGSDRPVPCCRPGPCCRAVA